MMIAAWPLVDRSRLVHAFRPGEPSTMEGPFRTLRGHDWATPGVRIVRRAGARLGGQLTIFSSLNVEAARLARRGANGAAQRLARASARLEAGTEFHRLRDLMSELPAEDVDRVVEGTLPEDPPTMLVDALRDLARRTEKLRARERALATLVDVIAGRIAEVHEGYVVLVRVNGPAAAVPLWMAVAAHRTSVGEHLVLVTDKLDGASAMVEALPAIDTDESPAFSPFGRGESRVRTLDAADERLLAGEPEPLHILVPVLIDA